MKNPKYWRSLAERHQAPEFKTALENEFGEAIEIETADGPTRRHILGVMGAATAMASMAGCIRRPVDYIVPYVRAPENALPGLAQHYATATSIAGNTIGLLVESHEGRPTKIEGNPDHPGSLGATNAIHQAMVLDLYDPARLKMPRHAKVPVKWSAVEDFFSTHFRALQDRGGQGLAFISEAIPSPTMTSLRTRIKASFPAARWVTYESVSDDNQRTGFKEAFGRICRPSYALHKASVVVSLDADFLATEGDSVIQASRWAQRRRLSKPGDSMSRLFVVEGQFSLTGSNADHRLRLAPSQVEKVAWAIADGVQAKLRTVAADIAGEASTLGAGLDAKAKAFVDVVVEELTARKNGQPGLLIVGRSQPPIVHAVAAAVNYAIGAHGTTVNYFPDHRRLDDDLGDFAGVKALHADLMAGHIDTLVVIGGNPVYTAPGDIDFAAAMAKAKTTICLADYPDETSKAATWAIPRAHFLEAWGDRVYTDGRVSIQQPLIAPLHGAWSEVELLAQILRHKITDGHGVVRGFWKTREGATGFHKKWRRWLHDGVLNKRFFGLAKVQGGSIGLRGLKGTSKMLAAPTADMMEIIFSPDSQIWDGRFANNSWLQEAPDPLTKVCWDNPAVLSPATAKRIGVADEDRLKVSLNGKTIETVTWILPGMADNVVAVKLGYGRSFDNFLPYHDRGVVGFDFNPLRTLVSPGFAQGVDVSKGAGTYPVACVQRFGRGGVKEVTPQADDLGLDHGYASRALVREASLIEYRKVPNFAKPGLIEHGKAIPQPHMVHHPPPKSIYGDFNYGETAAEVVFGPTGEETVPNPSKYQWGMVIDLNTCTGCNTCLVACVAENNIMSVGKDEVRRGREMHWIRLDRYFVGSDAEARVVHQPVPCMQCETAPCENVCPVAATAHSPEGLNDMAYNRCIGTRYCANNCPFKVRRFNFYNYSKGQDELVHMARNPNVTVRFRGVIEKCTYCVQRINWGKRQAKMAEGAKASKAIIDGITPACGQACPTSAITFGNIADRATTVFALKKSSRNYGMLTELNVRPRTTYLARVRNPNAKLEKA